MSPIERHYLGAFLRVLLFSDDFDYLLFGSKPIAAAEFDRFPPVNPSYKSMSRLNFEIDKGIEIFKKNQHLFSAKHIIVWVSDDEEGPFILMMNKENLIRTLKEHIHDFQQVLGPETTAEDLFNQIVENEYFADAVKHHQALIGILLGYGSENAWLFHRKNAIAVKMREFKPPLKRDDSLEKQFDEIHCMTGAFSQEDHRWKYVLTNPRIHLPHFMANPKSAETQKLKQQYGKEREEMKKLFSKQDFVEATLRKLMDE